MDHKKIANKGHEDESSLTSRDVGGPLSKTARRIKTYRNRAARREAARRALREHD